MSASGAPRWRQLFDRAEGAVTPAVEQLVRTTGFARAMAVATSSNAASRKAARALSARWWHQLNLPAATDVTRLRRELGALDREVRRLTLALDAARLHQPPGVPGQPQPQEEPDAERASAERRHQPGPPRRRAQPAADP